MWLSRKEDLLASMLGVYVWQLAKASVWLEAAELKPAQSNGLTCLREADRPTRLFEKQEPKGLRDPRSLNKLFKVVM